MNTQLLGTSSLRVTRLAYGCWRLAGTWNPSEVTPQSIEIGKKAVLAAHDAGYTLFDHADIYCSGEAEKIHGLVLRDNPRLRSQITLATKCGIRFPGQPNPESPQRYDFSAEHILRSCEDSLRRLNTDTIDLYQLHRPDFLMDPAEVASTFDQLRREGKVREFGISNFSPSQVTALQSACPMRLIVNQVEIHLGRLDCFSDGTLDQCLAQRMTPLAWSPLGRGFLGSGATVPDNHPRRSTLLALVDQLDKTAKAYSATRTTIALAWLLKHPAHIIPIVGSIQPDRIRESARADSINLSREDWYRLLLAARGEPLP